MESASSSQRNGFVIQQVTHGHGHHAGDDFESSAHYDDDYPSSSTKRVKLEKFAGEDSLVFEESLSAPAFNSSDYGNAGAASTIESLSREVSNLTRRLKRLEDTVRSNHNVVNNKLNIILDHFLKSGPSQPEPVLTPYSTPSYQPPLSYPPCADDTGLEETSFIPKQIDSRDAFDEMEVKLRNFDCDPLNHREFGRTRKQMVIFYSRRLSNINNRTDPKNGLMHSLMILYFDNDFLATIGWTAVGTRWAIKDAKGHFSLFRDIVNANSFNTYANCDEASHAVFTFLRRFHERRNKEAKSLLNEMMQQGVKDEKEAQ